MQNGEEATFILTGKILHTFLDSAYSPIPAT